MGLFENFPYTNFHELNLDWIVNTMKALDEKVDSIEDRIYNKSKAYTDEQIAILRTEFNSLEDEFIAFKADVNKMFTAYTAKQDKAFADYKALVNAQITLLEQEIRDAKAELQTLLAQANAYTDASIQMLLLQIPPIIGDQIKTAMVYNLLTGKYVTIQAMFDYLCMFHAPDALTCGDMYAKNNTCEQILAYIKTCQEFTTSAKNFVVQH
jgi:uncharacterized small protein (DUF1192 family)